MWMLDNASRLGLGADMDRLCPSYKAGYDACDPFGPVLDRREESRASRVLRRRCRSEGVERSPYEDVSHRGTESHTRSRGVPIKSHFTLNSSKGEDYRRDRFVHDCHQIAPENGDYAMAHDHGLFSLPTGRPKSNRVSPNRPLIVANVPNDESRLPKVEELLEKVEHEIMEVTLAKQPLKSILNKPLPISPPQGILKKPKIRSSLESKLTAEGRRRQRASSESDNLFHNFNSSPVTAFDSRGQYSAGNTKRAKDNSGIGYSYGTAIATFTAHSGHTQKVSPAYRKSPVLSKDTVVPKSQLPAVCKDQYDLKVDTPSMHVLRTTAINDVVTEFDGCDLSNTVCPAVSPALPVSSVTTVPPVKKAVRVARKKVKKKSSKMKSTSKIDNTNEDNDEDCLSRSPSPDNELGCNMETDVILSQLEKFEKLPETIISIVDGTEQSSVTKLSNKLNGAVVSKKIPNKEKTSRDRFLVALHTTNPFKAPTYKECPCTLPEPIVSCLRPSLFPRVPPYLKFVGAEDVAMSKVPLAIQKHLKWKLTTITPIVVKKTLTNSGFRLVKSECDTAECPQEETVEWIGIWGKHMKSLMFRAIKDGQKMNHFPGTFQIGRKDRLWRNLQKLVSKYGTKEFGIMPKSYVLPHDMKLLKHDWDKYAANEERWIIKPPASARGTGIKVVSRWTQIPKKRPVVVQKYVSKPYLINGSKFDMRLYVLVTSIHPLRIYLYNDGLARFASVKYNDELSSLNDRYMHLTNYSINRLSKNYTPNEDFTACEGHKWTLQTLFQYLKAEKNVDTEALWDSMKDLVIKTIISGEASISSLTKANITSRYNCYELFGVDVLLDEDLKPWLLEVNISPSLHSASPLDIHVKGPLVSAVLNLAQFQVPSKTNLESLTKDKPHKLGSLPYDSRLYTIYLSKEERDKHIIYTNMEDRDLYLRDILSTLTPDDVRHLIQAEDELTQLGAMERIFPSHKSHKYLNYLAGPRYYNRLFDAWETRYHRNREAGIELLRNLCDIGYHLEVPPIPLKRAALSAMARCRMTWTRLRRRPRACRWKCSPPPPPPPPPRRRPPPPPPPPPPPRPRSASRSHSARGRSVATPEDRPQNEHSPTATAENLQVRAHFDATTESLLLPEYQNAATVENPIQSVIREPRLCNECSVNSDNRNGQLQLCHWCSMNCKNLSAVTEDGQRRHLSSDRPATEQTMATGVDLNRNRCSDSIRTRTSSTVDSDINSKQNAIEHSTPTYTNSEIVEYY